MKPPTSQLIISLFAIAVLVGITQIKSHDFEFTKDNLTSIEKLVISTLRKKEGIQDEPAYVALRKNGERIASDWSNSLQTALEEAFSLTTITPDMVEVCLIRSYRDIPTLDFEAEDIHRGIWGIEISHGENTNRYSPTLMIERNWGYAQAREDFINTTNTKERGQIKERLFECDQILVFKEGKEATAVLMTRGNMGVDLPDVTYERTRDFATKLKIWLENNLHEDGRMTYKYWPSRKEESTSNNMIRQWMATYALSKIDISKNRLAENIAYNLYNYYEEEDGLGLISYNSEVKLGALALAALAIKNSGVRDQFSTEEKALDRTIHYLWQDNGSFKTFYRPTERDGDNENFYPGEALLYWSQIYKETKNQELLEKIMRSFKYYRDWHLQDKNRNPAFIPWHTQAYFLVWQETNDPALRDFIFEMNDWLLKVQQWETAPYPDMQGRFYNPTHPEYGPPHASATGAYLEGLIDAYQLAKEVGDTNRQEAYRIAIVRGVRSLIQLQFQDPVDMFYITEPQRVRGGLRTTVYNNGIRVDNVQHALLATLKILEVFKRNDFNLE